MSAEHDPMRHAVDEPQVLVWFRSERAGAVLDPRRARRLGVLLALSGAWFCASILALAPTISALILVGVLVTCFGSGVVVHSRRTLRRLDGETALPPARIVR